MLREVNGLPVVFREKQPSAKAAETRYKKHLTECSISTDEKHRCPARFDPYDLKKECLVHAVLREDWDQQRRLEDGRVWQRERTTETGYWIDDVDRREEAIAEERRRNDALGQDEDADV